MMLMMPQDRNKIYGVAIMMMMMIQDRGEEGRMGVAANGRGVSEALDGATGVSTFVIVIMTIGMTMTIIVTMTT